MRGHSVGGFGSVTTNKVIATIAGDVFGKDVQAYPKYGSEKKGLPTTYYLTIADSHIYSHSELEYRRSGRAQRHDGAVQRQSAGRTGRGRRGLHAVALCQRPSMFGSGFRLMHKKTIREKNIRVYLLDMVQIAREVASRPTCRCGCRASCCWARS